MKRVFWVAALIVAVGGVIAVTMLVHERRREVGGGLLFASSRGEACLTCHKGIEEVHPKAPLYCTACHKGDGHATDKAAAHQGLIPNPADLTVADQTCGTCHRSIVDRVKRSMMATRSGTTSATFYLNGLQSTKEAVSYTFSNYEVDALPGNLPPKPGTVGKLLPFPTYAQTHNPFVDLMRKECMQCHLWTEGVQRNADYRGTGCAACHMTYDAEGLSQSGDPTIPKNKHGHPIKHVLTKQVPVSTCATCHAGGNRIGLTFTGRMEQSGRYDILGQDLEHGHTYSDQIPDIHYEKGMVCIDCHTINEIHGDGNLYAKKNFQLEIRCEVCHGTPEQYGTGITAMGHRLPNIRIEQPAQGAGSFTMTLISKLDGKAHVVPQVKDAMAAKAVEAHRIDAHMTKMECYACHTAWVPKCMGCHIKLDLTRQPTPINVSYDHLANRQSDFGLYTLMPGVRVAEPDYLLGINQRGKVVPFAPRSSVVYTFVDESGKELYQRRPQMTADGKLGFAHNGAIPHTVRKETRSCKSCHESRKALGLGASTSKDYSKLKGLMPDDFVWDRIVDENGKPVQQTSLEQARPFNKAEMDRIQGALKGRYAQMAGMAHE
jgi:hypothetical protein